MTNGNCPKQLEKFKFHRTIARQCTYKWSEGRRIEPCIIALKKQKSADLLRFKIKKMPIYCVEKA